MTSAFLLPEGNVQIAFSGGRTSAYMLHQILEANGGLPEPRVQITFQNTGREMPATLDFVAEVGQRWGVAITWLEYRPTAPFYEIIGRQGAAENGEPFEALIRRRRFLPNQKSRFCTTELKVRTAKRWLCSLGWKRWTNCVGLRADEPERLAGLPQSWEPAGEWVAVEGKKRPVWEGEPRAKDRWIVWTPLADAGVSKHDVALFWRRQPFDLRLPNVRGKTVLGNCDGCFLKSEAHVAMLARDYPERHAWWERMEALASELSNAKGITPGRGAWFSKRYSRREMREFMDRQGDFALSDEGTALGLLCQADGGECFG